MNDDRIILGVYINPWVWILKDGEEYEKLKEISFDIRDLIFHSELTNKVEICIQRQGFVIASFSKDFFDVDFNTAHINLLVFS